MSGFLIYNGKNNFQGLFLRPGPEILFQVKNPDILGIIQATKKQVT